MKNKDKKEISDKMMKDILISEKEYQEGKYESFSNVEDLLKI